MLFIKSRYGRCFTLRLDFRTDAGNTAQIQQAHSKATDNSQRIHAIIDEYMDGMKTKLQDLFDNIPDKI